VGGMDGVIVDDCPFRAIFLVGEGEGGGVGVEQGLGAAPGHFSRISRRGLGIVESVDVASSQGRCARRGEGGGRRRQKAALVKLPMARDFVVADLRPSVTHQRETLTETGSLACGTGSARRQPSIYCSVAFQHLGVVPSRWHGLCRASSSKCAPMARSVT
jgi:hypothetical protein